MMTWKCSDAQAITFAAAKPTPELAPVMRTIVEDMLKMLGGFEFGKMLWLNGLK